MKNSNLKFTAASLLVAGLAAFACMSPTRALAHDDKSAGILPPSSRAFGKTYTEWFEVYWRWYADLAYNGIVTIPPDANGNAVADHNVVLMLLPDAPGDGTPGHLAVTLDAGQSFVLPFLGPLGTSYNDGTPADPFVSDSLFQTLDVQFYVDGVRKVSSRSSERYYTKDEFDPAIPLPGLAQYGFEAVIWFQTVGIFHSPLSPGTHTLQLDIINTEPFPPYFPGEFVEYHNTWTVTVLPEDHGDCRPGHGNGDGDKDRDDGRRGRH